MVKWVKETDEITIKVAIVGQQGAGKNSILKHIARVRDQSGVRTSVVSGAEIIRTEFIWPDPLPDGTFIKVRVLALSGNPLHQAAEQLLLENCHALVFVVDCDPEKIAESKGRLAAMNANANHVGLNWADMVFELQYHRAELYPALNAGELDSWLGIDGGRVERYTTRSDNTDDIAVAVNSAVAKVIGRLAVQGQ